MMLSLAFLAAGVALTTLVHAPWQLILLWGLVVGMGTGMTAIVLGATVVHRWFRKEQGLLIGILTASSYDLAFSISGIACIAAAVGVLLIGRTSDSGFFRRNHKIQQPATAQQY
jgi:MFS family permease